MKTPLSLTKTAPDFSGVSSGSASSTPTNSLPTDAFASWLESFLMAGDIAQHTPRTLASRRERLSRLHWFLRLKEYPNCGLPELRAFFHYLNHGHKDGGRWGNSTHKNTVKPLSPGRVKAFHSTFRTFFNWLVEEGVLPATPMKRIPPPIDRPDQIQPFSDDQINALLKSATRSQSPKRDETLLLIMLDTGVRACELMGLDIGDVDLTGCQLTVRYGKGGKSRCCPFSRETRKMIYQYLKERGITEADKNAPLFVSERGPRTGDRLQQYALIHIYRRLGIAGKVTGVRCSPHTMRHTFAISFLRAGGNVFTLKTILGHESLAMTNRYVALAQADVTRQHAQFSPVARLKGSKGG